MARHNGDDVPFVRRADDDDDYYDEPRGGSGGTTVLLIIMLAVGLLVAGVAAVGALFFFVSHSSPAPQAVGPPPVFLPGDVELPGEPAVEAVPEADPFPDPNPPARDDPPADLGPPREPERQGHWTVLFRSDDPAYWDTPGNASHYAVPLKSAPEKAKYLRLKRMDTGEAVIVALNPGRLKEVDYPAGSGLRWNGTNKNEFSGRHLGIIQGPRVRFTTGQGRVSVMNDGWDAFVGSGFGHKHHVENAGQRYSWQGREIARTAFEVAVTDAELTDDERGLLANVGL